MLKNRTSNWRLVLLNAIIITVAFFVVAIAIGGYNSVNGSFDSGQGWSLITSIFGGLYSFGAIMAVVIVSAVVVLGMTQLANSKMNNLWVGILALALLILGIIIGGDWIDLPVQSIMIVLGFIALVAVTAVAVTSPGTKVVAVPAKTSTTTAAPATVTS